MSPLHGERCTPPCDIVYARMSARNLGRIRWNDVLPSGLLAIQCLLMQKRPTYMAKEICRAFKRYTAY